MRIDAYSTVGSYWDHLAPIWAALPDDVRCTLYTTRSFSPTLGAIPHVVGYPPRSPNLILVASWVEEQKMHRIGRRVVYCEHGAGQTYGPDRNPSYSGGRDHNAIAYLCPNETVAARWREHYPNAAVFVVGCPKLDSYVDQRPDPAGPIAISMHHDSPACPESRWAFPYWSRYLRGVSIEFPILGHGHPRVYRRLTSFWDAIKVPHTPDFDEVLRQASMLVIDNSSVGFEAAWCGLPVVWLNSPAYRRDVEHGLRFWEATRHMPCVDTLGELVAALRSPPEPATAYAETILGPRDGKATDRAVQAVLEVADGLS